MFTSTQSHSRIPLQLNWLCALFLFFPIGTETGPVIRQWCAQVKVKSRHQQMRRCEENNLFYPFLSSPACEEGPDLIVYTEQKQGSGHKRWFKYLDFWTRARAHAPGIAEKHGCAAGHLNVSGLRGKLTFFNLKYRDANSRGGNNDKIQFQSITLTRHKESEPFQRCTLNCKRLGDNRVRLLRREIIDKSQVC